MRTDRRTEMMKPMIVCRNFTNAPKIERKWTKFIDSLRKSDSKGGWKCVPPPQCCQMKKFKTSMQSDFPVPLPLSLRFRHSFLTTQKWKRVLLPKSNHRFFQAQTDISLISHLGIKQMSRREKWTRKRTYELRTGCILWGDKLKWALWKLISLLLGHIFMWLLGLEGDLGFKTGYSLPVLYCRYTRLHLAHSHKIEGNIMVPWTYLVLLPFTLLLFLSESELIYCQALCCLCQIQKKGILLNPVP